MCEACSEFAKFHVPILPYPMPACGSTGPASLYTNIAVANAEALSALVLFQMASPGTPIIMGHAAGIMNFNSGAASSKARPNPASSTAASARCPDSTACPTPRLDAVPTPRPPGAQAIMEKMFTILPLVLSGTEIINGIGEIEASQLLI
jgi:trimethylamine---corrinoid protein Co-methyltransferase